MTTTEVTLDTDIRSLDMVEILGHGSTLGEAFAFAQGFYGAMSAWAKSYGADARNATNILRYSHQSRNLNNGQIYALWVDVNLEAAEAAWYQTMSPLLLLEAWTDEDLATSTKAGRARARARNKATKTAYGLTYSAFLKVQAL